MKKLIFDVEATSLFGTAIAVASVVVDENKKVVDSIELCSEEYFEECSDWVKQNVLPKIKDMPRCKNNKEMRELFWNFLQKHKDAQVWVDCGYPVETNFLNTIAHDDIAHRELAMPYPLYEIAVKSLEKEHNPMQDVMTSLSFI